MECEKRNKTKLLLFYSFGTESDVHRCTTVGYAYVKNNPLKYLDAMGTQISNNRSTWERITTGLGNSFSTLWDRRDDIGNDINTAYDGGVQGAQDMLVNAPTYAKLPLYVASSITVAPIIDVAIIYSIKNPLDTVNTLNDIINPSMPPNTKYGTRINLAREILDMVK